MVGCSVIGLAWYSTCDWKQFCHRMQAHMQGGGGGGGSGGSGGSEIPPFPRICLRAWNV